MRYRKKAQRDYHKQVTNRSKKIFPTPKDLVADSETKASTGAKVKRNRKSFNKYRLLTQIVLMTLIFAFFYIYVTTLYPLNGFMYLIAFTCLYSFVSIIIGVYALRYFTGEKYKLGAIFQEISYTLGIVIGTFAVIYLPTLLILFVADRSYEWIKYAFIIALIIFPLSYIMSIISRFMREEGLTLKQVIRNVFDKETRTNKKRLNKEKSRKLEEFYDEFNKVAQNYEKRVSNVLKEDDFKSL